MEDVKKCIGGGVGLQFGEKIIGEGDLSGESCVMTGDGNQGKCFSVGLPKSEARLSLGHIHTMILFLQLIPFQVPKAMTCV